MEKITLKLHEVLSLEAELNGIVNQGTGEKLKAGVLDLTLPLPVKYWLTKLSKKLADERKTVEALRIELIKKLGTEEEDGTVNIPQNITEVDQDGKPVMITVKNKDGEDEEVEKIILNPVWLAFQEEYNKLLETEKEIEYRPIKLEELSSKDDPNGIAVTDNYDIFFQLIEAE